MSKLRTNRCRTASHIYKLESEFHPIIPFAQLQIDFSKLYDKLSPAIQDWLPLPQLKDPDVIDTREHKVELLVDLYRILEMSKGTQDPDYPDVFKELPIYIESVNRSLVQADPAEGTELDYDKYFHNDFVQAEVGGWLTRPMLTTPTRMTHKQQAQMLKVSTNLCHKMGPTDPDFETVTVHLPAWNSKVCVAIMQAEVPPMVRAKRSLF